MVHGLTKHGNNFVDLVGHKYGELTIVAFYGKDKYNRSIFQCNCSCGKENVVVSSNNIRTGHTTSCGCASFKRKFDSLVGQIFNYLTVIQYIGVIANNRCYKCLCKCGKTTTVPQYALKTGKIKSCGCLREEVCRKIGKIKGPAKGCYNHKITNEERLLKKEYRCSTDKKRQKWRQKVLKRDGFRCVLCNKIGYIVAHHLEGWKENISLRYITTNGITLCYQHHRCFHSLYGKNKATRKKFLDFKKRCENKEITQGMLDKYKNN